MRIDIEPYAAGTSSPSPGSCAATGEPVAADDVAELRWFARDELPDEMAFPGQELRPTRLGRRGSSTRSARGSIVNSIGVSSSSGSPSIAARSRPGRRRSSNRSRSALYPSAGAGDPPAT